VTAVFTWQQLAISREGQITERFTRAVELLGSDDRAVRVGAIRALERLSKDSRSDDRAIYGLLNAYIRHHSPYRPGRRPITAPIGPGDGTGDATTDARQQGRAERVDLGEARLEGASLKGARFYGADLRGAHLENAKLTGADLTDAKLAGATYDTRTRFPDGFDPETHGLLLVRDAG
jgi:hypothetical protein